MSHVARIDVQVTNLDDLRTACAELGLEFVEGQQTYEWFGQTNLEESPLPEGFHAEDLGRCEHAIRLNTSARLAAWNEHEHAPYEIGVSKRRDGQPGWVLMWDYFQGGYGLMNVIGQRGGLLKQAIGIAATIRTMKAQGYRLERKTLPNGTIRVECIG